MLYRSSFELARGQTCGAEAGQRYPYEVRDQEDYFDDIEDEKVPKDMLDLATHIVETKKGSLRLRNSRTATRAR